MRSFTVAQRKSDVEKGGSSNLPGLNHGIDRQVQKPAPLRRSTGHLISHRAKNENGSENRPRFLAGHCDCFSLLQSLFFIRYLKARPPIGR